MRSLFKTQFISIIVIIIFLMLPVITVAEESITDTKEINSSAFQDPVDSSDQLIPVKFYLHPNSELNPQLPKESKSDSFATCPNGFVPARWALFLKIFGHTEWRDVGRWTTIEVSKPLKATGIVSFKLWAGYTGSGSATGTFDFIWQRNNENIAEARNKQIGFQEGMDPTLVEYTAPLINQTPFEAGDKFSLYIRCRNNFDGAQFIYGSRKHSSSVIMNCDPIELVEIQVDKKKVKGFYDDIFSVRPADMTFEGKVDNVLIDSIPEINSEQFNERHYNTITWEKKIEPGEHGVEIRISYGGMSNETVVSLSKQIVIEEETEPSILGIPLSIFYWILFIIIILIAISVAFKVKDKLEERKWLQEQEQRFQSQSTENS